MSRVARKAQTKSQWRAKKARQYGIRAVENFRRLSKSTKGR